MRDWVVLFAACALMMPSVAYGQDLEAELAQVQAAATEAGAKVAAAQERVTAAEAIAEPLLTKEERAGNRAARATAVVAEIRSGLADDREDASATIAAMESEHSAEVADHDRRADFGLGLALGGLALAAIAVFWSGFRSIGLAQGLAKMTWRQALGKIAAAGAGPLIGGLVLMQSEGIARVIGVAVALLSLGVAGAFMLARHSLRVEQEVGQPIWTRDRLPRWSTLLLALLLLLLFAGGLGTALSEEPAPPVISAELRATAERTKNPALLAAQKTAEPLVASASKLAQAREKAEDALQEAKSKLAAAKQQLNDARNDAQRLAREIQVQAERAARVAARQQARAAAQAERAAAQAQPAVPSAPSTPDYTNCDSAPDNVAVPPGSPLDADGDGVGCET